MLIPLEEIKLHLRVDHDDEDEFIQRKYDAALDYAKNYCGRALDFFLACFQG